MDAQAVELRTMSRVSLRLLPFLLCLNIFNFLDRTNVSVAALQMNEELKFDPAVFGFGAGIFFAGYSLLEVPAEMTARFSCSRALAHSVVSPVLDCVSRHILRDAKRHRRGLLRASASASQLLQATALTEHL
jgi:hypothetical protein